MRLNSKLSQTKVIILISNEVDFWPCSSLHAAGKLKYWQGRLPLFHTLLVLTVGYCLGWSFIKGNEMFLPSHFTLLINETDWWSCFEPPESNKGSQYSRTRKTKKLDCVFSYTLTCKSKSHWGGWDRNSNNYLIIQVAHLNLSSTNLSFPIIFRLRQ